jgi:hypothetical protein
MGSPLKGLDLVLYFEAGLDAAGHSMLRGRQNSYFSTTSQMARVINDQASSGSRIVCSAVATSCG